MSRPLRTDRQHLWDALVTYFGIIGFYLLLALGGIWVERLLHRWDWL